MINYVIINGVNSNTKNGLMINELPPITKPLMRTQTEEIDGRDGDIITKLGYSAYDKTITIGLWGTSYDVNDIIAFFNKEGIITFSNEPDKYYKFTMLDDFDIETLLRFKTASITFHCQPYKYPTEETPIELEYEYIEQDNVESASLNNTNGDSHLDITLKGNTSQNGTNLFDKTTFHLGDITGVNTNNRICSYQNLYLEVGTYTFNTNLSNTFRYYLSINSVGYPPLSGYPTYSYNSNWKQDNSLTFTITTAGYFVITISKSDDSNITLNDINGFNYNLIIATPTPDTPIPINVVSGDNEVVVCGKNIFNHNWLVQGMLNNNYYDNSSSATRTNALLLKAGTYSYSFTYPTAIWVKLFTYGNATDSVAKEGIFNLSTNSYTKTFTLAQDTYVRFGFDETIANIKENATIQLELSTTPTTYEPYQSQTYPIYLGVENLIKYVSGSTYLNNLTIVENDNGSINISGTPNQTWANLTPDITYTIKKGTYTFSLNKSLAFNIGIRLWNDGTDGINKTITTGNTQLTFTTTKDYANYRIFFENLNTSTNYNIIDLETQLEEGSKANSYSPFGQTPIELCKIGDYQDYFTKNSEGQWCKYNAIGKVVWTGANTESWTLNPGISNTFVIARPSDLAQANNNVFYNYFATVPNLSVAIEGARIGGNINLKNKDISTVENFRTWLGTHNTVMYYQSTQPYLSLIEDNNLIEQLDNIQNALSYEGQTNIGQVNNDKAFIMDLKAMKDGTDEVVVNNIGNTYSKPTIALEGTGDINIYLNGTQMLKATLTDKMTIDTTNLEAYNPDTMTLLNRQLVGDISKFTLSSGNNTIKMDGALTKATITDYVRYL